MRGVLWIVATYDAYNFLTMVGEYLLSNLVIYWSPYLIIISRDKGHYLVYLG